MITIMKGDSIIICTKKTYENQYANQGFQLVPLVKEEGAIEQMAPLSINDKEKIDIKKPKEENEVEKNNKEEAENKDYILNKYIKPKGKSI